MKEFEGALERKENFIQNVHFKVCFSLHAKREDAQSLEEEIKSSHVLVPEMMGWDFKLLKKLNEIAQGKIPLDQLDKEVSNLQFPEYHLKLFEIISGSKKQIMFIDLPSDHPLYKKIKIAEEELSQKKRILPEDISQFIRELKKIYEKIGSLQLERENYMLSRLKEELLKISSRNLSQGEEISVLIICGIFHTNFYHQLKKKVGERAEAKFIPFVFKIEDEIERRVIFGKEISDELVLRAWFESLIFLAGIGRDLEKVTENIKSRNSLLRKIVFAFTKEEIEQIYQNVREITLGEIDALNYGVLSSFLREKLREKGFEIKT